MKKFISIFLTTICILNLIFASYSTNVDGRQYQDVQYDASITNGKEYAYNIAKEYLDIALSYGIDYIRRSRMKKLLQLYEGIPEVDANYAVDVTFDRAGIVDGEFTTLYIEDALIAFTYKTLKGLETIGFKELNVSGLDVIKNAIGLNDKKKVREDLALKYAKFHFNNLYFISRNSLVKILKSYGWNESEATIAASGCGDWSDKAFKFATIVKLENPSYEEDEIKEYLKSYHYTDAEASVAAKRIMKGELSDPVKLTDEEITQAFINNGFTSYEAEYFLEKTKEFATDVTEIQIADKKKGVTSNNQYIVTGSLEKKDDAMPSISENVNNGGYISVEHKTEDNSEVIEYIKDVCKHEFLSRKNLVSRVNKNFDMDITKINQVLMLMNIDFNEQAFEKIKILIENGEHNSFMLSDKLADEKFETEEINYAIDKAKEHGLIS